MLRNVCTTKDQELRNKNLLKLHEWYNNKMRVLGDKIKAPAD